MRTVTIRYCPVWPGKIAIAARVAAALKSDSALRVEKVRGGFGELSVAVDGERVYESAWYPRPRTVIEAVRRRL